MKGMNGDNGGQNHLPASASLRRAFAVRAGEIEAQRIVPANLINQLRNIGIRLTEEEKQNAA